MAFYKANRELFQRGRFVRLRSPFEDGGNQAAWMVVAPDASRAVVGFYQVLNRPVPADDRLRLRGLDPGVVYRVSGWPDDGDLLYRDNAGLRGGDELMGVGLSLGAERHEAGRVGGFPRLGLRARGRLGQPAPGVNRFRGALGHPFCGLTGPTPDRLRTILSGSDGAHAAPRRRSPIVECMRLGESS